MSPNGGGFDEKEVSSRGSQEKVEKNLDLLSWGSVERRKLINSGILINLSTLPSVI